MKKLKNGEIVDFSPAEWEAFQAERMASKQRRADRKAAQAAEKAQRRADLAAANSVPALRAVVESILDELRL